MTIAPIIAATPTPAMILFFRFFGRTRNTVVRTNRMMKPALANRRPISLWNSSVPPKMISNENASAV